MMSATEYAESDMSAGSTYTTTATATRGTARGTTRSAGRAAGRGATAAAVGREGDVGFEDAEGGTVLEHVVPVARRASRGAGHGERVGDKSV